MTMNASTYSQTIYYFDSKGEIIKSERFGTLPFILEVGMFITDFGTDDRYKVVGIREYETLYAIVDLEYSHTELPVFSKPSQTVYYDLNEKVYLTVLEDALYWATRFDDEIPEYLDGFWELSDDATVIVRFWNNDRQIVSTHLVD